MYRNILAEMARCAYTRADLAKNLNMSIATLRKKIKGETPFKMEEISKLLSIFGRSVTFEYLFKDSN